MRLALVLLLVGCGARGAGGPAWPKQHEAAADGGESLAPHAPNAIAAAAILDDGLGDLDPGPTKPAVAATPVPDAPPATAAPAAKPAAPDEPLQTEDLIIEIED